LLLLKIDILVHRLVCHVAAVSGYSFNAFMVLASMVSRRIY